MIDISYNKDGIAGRLSNFTRRHFFVEHVECWSLEGWLQSLKYKEFVDQERLCRFFGPLAKSEGKYAPDWRKDQTLYWLRQPINRHSDRYYDLLMFGFTSCFNQDRTFKGDLRSTGTMPLEHTVGHNDPYETILTADEFVKILTHLRSEDAKTNR